MKENAQALIKQFHKERNEKKANQVSSLLLSIDNQLLKSADAPTSWKFEIRSFYQEMRPVPLALFKCEYERLIRTGDAKACRALQRSRKRRPPMERH